MASPPPLPSFLSSPPSRKARKLTRVAQARAAARAPTQAAAVFASELNLLTHEMHEDTHRRRLRIEKVVNDLGQDTGRRRAVLALKPGKTDPAGARRFEKSLIVDSDAHSLSAGYALVCMIQGASPQAGAPSTVPLFLDPATGMELTYTDAAADLKRLLRDAGFHDLSLQLHSLRIGGATCAAEHGGQYVAGSLGCWTSSSQYRYVHAMRDPIEKACYAMARAESGVLAVRPGPQAAYAR